MFAGVRKQEGWPERLQLRLLIQNITNEEGCEMIRMLLVPSSAYCCLTDTPQKESSFFSNLFPWPVTLDNWQAQPAWKVYGTHSK